MSLDKRKIDTRKREPRELARKLEDRQGGSTAEAVNLSLPGHSPLGPQSPRALREICVPAINQLRLRPRPNVGDDFNDLVDLVLLPISGIKPLLCECYSTSSMKLLTDY